MLLFFGFIEIFVLVVVIGGVSYEVEDWNMVLVIGVFVFMLLGLKWELDDFGVFFGEEVGII